MSSFTNALIARKTTGRNWRTVRPFTYEVGRLGSGNKITVPANYDTDLTDVPRACWSILPPDGSYSQAAVLHDWLCGCRGKTAARDYTQREVSEIFHEALGVCGVGGWRRSAMFYAVLWFGPKW